MSRQFPPRGWLKFNVYGVVFEDKAGGGGELRDEDGAANRVKIGKVALFFAEIERRSYLSFRKAEHMGNTMAFALAIAGVKRLDTFKAW
ncbi:hypothetical protein Golax_016188, partial [Gossypium laxum]|nr:hypothetical protein [Gossypium laxum]